MPRKTADTVSVAQAADLLCVSRNQVYRWMRDGLLASCVTGKRRRIERDELERFRRSHGIPCGYSGRVFTTGQAARVLGVSIRSVIRWVDEGILPGFRLPGTLRRRILEHDLAAFRPSGAGRLRVLLLGGAELDGIARILSDLDVEVERTASALDAGARMAGSLFRMLVIDHDRFPESFEARRNREMVFVAVSRRRDPCPGSDAVISFEAGPRELQRLLPVSYNPRS